MRKFLGKIGFASLVAFSVTGAGFMVAAMPTQADRCEVVHAGDPAVGQGTWDLLIEKGWTGNPYDSMEALYSPACQAPTVNWDVDTSSDRP